MIGYKLMESDMTCRGFQYEIGKEYSLEEKSKMCKTGFHFCKNPFECLKYYNNINGNKRLFLIEALGDVITDDDKSVANKIKIIKEIPNIEKFFDKNIKNFNVKWYVISMRQKLSEKFIKKHSDKVYWATISIYQTLSEKLIDKYKNKVDWDSISIYQTLSEKFIKKHCDKVDWDSISKHQVLSEEFIKKHSDKINS